MTDTITEAPAAAREEPPFSTAARIMRGFGWTFIWLGILAVGFVVHQIYITMWFAQLEQTELTAERLEYFEAAAETIRPIIVNEAGVPIIDLTTGEPIVPDPTVIPPLPLEDAGGSDGPADRVPGGALLGPLVIYPEPDVSRGAAFAVIRIPVLDSLKDGWTLVEGVKLRQLRKGAGHMPWTPYPGQRGNSVISGHRTTNGAPFRDLDQLEPGDRIEVETAVGLHVYEVRLVKIVKPSALWVTNPNGPKRAGLDGGADGAWLTLTTCHPQLSARLRLIVFAEMVAGPNFDTIDRLTG